MSSVWLEILLFILSFLGVMIGVLGLPGNFVPVLVALAAVLAGDGTSFTWLWFGIFLALAVSGEAVDQITGIIGAKKYGAGRAGMAGAAVGGLVGGLLGTAVLPVIGSIIGVFLGCFALAFAFELLFSKRSTEDAVQVGLGAVMGKAVATAYKFVAGFVLLILMAWRFWLT